MSHSISGKNAATDVLRGLHATALNMLKRLLAHPLTRGLDLDDPRTTVQRLAIIKGKPFLRQLYTEWYSEICDAIPAGDAPVLELGSGGGFLKEFIPGLITSDVFQIPDLSLVLDGTALPFRPASLRGIALTEVLHHIPDAGGFLGEAARCLQPGGVLVMIEPWVTPWARIVWGPLHHEPFLPDTQSWSFPTSGPLSGANGALPWIVFERDREIFRERFPEFEIRSIRVNLPLRYLLSGGVSMRSLMPGWSFPAWLKFERWLDPWMKTIGTFATIVLVRR